MSRYSKYYETIDGMESLIKDDFFGPISENEIIENSTPLDTYICGILYPQRTIKSAEEKFEELDTMEECITDMDDTILETNKYKPSAMAITVMLPAKATSIDIYFCFAKYAHEIENELSKGSNSNKYLRHPYKIVEKINILDTIGKTVISDYANDLQFSIEVYIRKIMENGDKVVTVAILNLAKTPNEIIKQNINALFQCKLSVLLSEGEFIPIYSKENDLTNEDVLISNMQYSKVNNYSYGHGCATKIILVESKLSRIDTEFIPSQEVLQMMAGDLKNNEFLNMTYLVNSSRDKIIKDLIGFVDEYKEWLHFQRDISDKMNSHKEAASLVLKRIDVCIKRLEEGILILSKDDIAYKSFVYMNEAMLLQRIKTKGCSSDEVFWYPFQLAYVLQIIPDIVNKNSEFRNYVDLLWFPTGGGKTEAYLGVCSFTIFFRRINNNLNDDGVAIIMRYTLRLLTIQQFERASALICACEYLRRRYLINGGEINIGLWIGSSMTPNKIDEAKEILTSIKDNPNNKFIQSNPQQITKCPWCGATIDIGCYNIFDNSMVISCKNNQRCDFHESLPIYVVDDDIYKKRPTLLLSTVDKFARIVWEEKTKKIFGTDGYLPPELIIQDELHLISGPLGSIAGIYEIAIQKLCEHKNYGPKVIASTATVRNATNQVNKLYNKKVFQFPPSGISYKDSFFAMEASKESRPARRYIGLCNYSGSMTDLFIRLYANLFFYKTILKKQDIDSSIIDQYYTNIGYFNSIKDLGSLSSILQDRIRVSTKSLAKQKFKTLATKHNIEENDFKGIWTYDELTSRKSSTDIKNTLDNLDYSYDTGKSYSYVLASNMLSVGIDINRLGVMSVYNQPKTNAEYIQATSRVGRSNPGVVFSMFNSLRSRDKSHYEQFEFYHKTLYQYVESTSVTPFTTRAIEKALHAVFVGLVRHKVIGMLGNDKASFFKCDCKEVNEIKNEILEYIKNVNTENYMYAVQYLEYFAETWEKCARKYPETFKYVDYNGDICLINSAEKDYELPVPPTLNALRNVESTSNVYVLRREL